MTEETTGQDEYGPALETAHRHAKTWLDSLAERPVRPDLDVDGILARLAQELPDGGLDAASVVEELAEATAPGLMAMGSPRFYGFVIGGAYPAAIAADWLVSAWDQNTTLHAMSPAMSPPSAGTRTVFTPPRVATRSAPGSARPAATK